MIFKQANFAIVPLLVLLMWGCARTPQARFDRALSRAHKFVQQKDYARALLECRTAVQAMPKNAEGYYQLGVVYERLHQPQNAVYSFNKALQWKPAFENAQVELAGIMASTADRTTLQTAQERMSLVLQGDPKNAEALDTLALAELKLGETGDAVQRLEQALTAAPASLRSSALLAQAKASEGDFEGAEQVLQKACQESNHSAAALMILAQFHIARKNLPQAEQELREAVKADPTNGPARLELARAQLQMGQGQEGERTLQQLSKSSDKRLNPSYGVFLFRQGKKTEALREFERLARADPQDRQARTRLVAAYWSAGEKGRAASVLDAALAANKNDSDALLQRAQIGIAEGKYLGAEEDLNAVLHMDAGSAEAHYLLSEVSAAQNDGLRQRQELGEALRLNPQWLRVRLEMARLFIRSNGAESALKLLADAPGAQKNSAAVLVERDWALMAAGDMDSARKGIDAGLRAEGNSPDFLLQDGIWKLRSEKTEAARTTFDRVLTLDPRNVPALRALYASYSDAHQNAVGVGRVKLYAAKAADSAAVQEFLAEVLMANGNNQEARTALNSVLKLDPGRKAARLRLIRLDMRDGKTDAAMDKINAELVANPNDQQVRLWLANLDEMKGDHAGALANYQQVVAADPKNTQALNNLAYLLIDYKNKPDAALPYAQKAQELAPGNPDYNDTVGWVFYRQGRYHLAAQSFEAALSSPAATPVCRYHLAMAYAKLGERDRGRVVLQAALKQNPKLPEASTAMSLLRQ